MAILRVLDEFEYVKTTVSEIASKFHKYQHRMEPEIIKVKIPFKLFKYLLGIEEDSPVFSSILKGLPGLFDINGCFTEINNDSEDIYIFQETGATKQVMLTPSKSFVYLR